MGLRQKASEHIIKMFTLVYMRFGKPDIILFDCMLNCNDNYHK